MQSRISLPMQLKSGFSLIEVIIFTSILSIIFVAAASIMTYTMKQNSVQIDKLYATHHNDELNEWIRGEREVGWSEFTTYALAGYPDASIYCFSDESPQWTAAINSVNDCAFSLNEKFRRYAVIKASNSSPTTRIEVTINTDWMDGLSLRNAQFHSVYSL